MKKLRVTVEGKAYEVLVEILEEGQAASAPVSAPIASASVSAPAAAPKPAPKPAAASSGSGDVTSPLAGKVVSIDVKEGQKVEDGQQVATIEAMKMNTYVYAGKAGTVSSVLAKAGDGVDEGAVLLKIA
jgi:glutaconyl-CoA/methylmalonyl-CoA decarboxylase subunit gamma